MAFPSSKKLVIAMTLISLHGCTTEPHTADKETTSASEHEEKKHVNLPTMKVYPSVVAQKITFPGKVNALPDCSVSVTSNISGKITSIRVVPGQSVTKGELIATLDDRQIRAQLLQAQAPLKTALNAVAQAKIALALAEKNLSRTQALFDKDIVAQKDVVAAQSQAELAKSQVEAAEAKVSEVRTAPSQINTQLAFTKIFSPLSGLVAHRYLNVGSAADPATPIVHVVNLNQVIVNANMPADSPSNPRVGDFAEITTVAEPGVVYRGQIKSVSPMVDATNNTVSIELLSKNDHLRLKEGQQVNVSISTSSIRAVLIPETSIVPGHDDPSELFVYVVKDGKVKLQKVVTATKSGDSIPVIKGLNSGDEIVSKGAYGVPDGAILDRGTAQR
ncbi:MAG: efflux RND transporter periplasmic adaptor subunit [Cyanobacteria bacterium SZAS-4]|nr:efflux RND transporter periplasmic adaptor subunit [Cyanobacteria bacterium SZAS-4]